jgi:hypothetical protein
VRRPGFLLAKVGVISTTLVSARGRPRGHDLARTRDSDAILRRDFALLASRFASMARPAKRLAIRHVVPGTTLANRHNVVCLCVLLADSPAGFALPRVPRKHSLTPPPVCLVAVPACRRIWPGTLVPPLTRRTEPKRPMGGYALRHKGGRISSSASRPQPCRCCSWWRSRSSGTRCRTLHPAASRPGHPCWKRPA